VYNNYTLLYLRLWLAF